MPVVAAAAVKSAAVSTPEKAANMVGVCGYVHLYCFNVAQEPFPWNVKPYIEVQLEGLHDVAQSAKPRDQVMHWNMRVDVSRGEA